MTITGGSWQIMPSGKTHRHDHALGDHDVLIQSLKGRVRYGCGAHDVELAPGQLLIIPRHLPQHHWSVVDDQPWEVRYFYWRCHPKEAAWLSYPADPSGLIVFPAADEIATIVDTPFRRLFELWGRQEATAVLLREQLAAIILHEIKLFFAASTPTQELSVARVLDHIDRHLSNPDLQLADLVAASGQGRSVCIRRFTTAMGVPPMRYLEQRRLDIAYQALHKELGTVASIAASVGYSSPRYFATRFRKYYACTPSSVATKARPPDAGA